jgi:protein SCO1
MTRLYASVAAIGTLAFLGASTWYVLLNRVDDQFADCRQSTVAGGDIGGSFTLVNTTGQTVTDKDVLKQPSLVYFGYTFCPDVCPVDVARNADAVDILAKQGINVTPVFITIDPERDTPAVLADYAANLSPDLVALSGSADQIKTAAQAYKAFYAKQDTGDEYYLMDHSTFTYLMLPDTGFAEFFRREVTAEQMAEGVACFVKSGKTDT